MSETIYQEVLRHLRAGQPESLLFACACSGCPDEFWTEGTCACGKRCRCACTLPGMQESMAARNAEIQGYIDRAKAQLEMERNDAMNARFLNPGPGYIVQNYPPDQPGDGGMSNEFTAICWDSMLGDPVARVRLDRDVPRDQLLRQLSRVRIDGTDYEVLGVESFCLPLISAGSVIGLRVKSGREVVAG